MNAAPQRSPSRGAIRHGDRDDDMNVTVESSGGLSPMDLGRPRSKGIVIGFWIVTALFCLQIGFTAYAQLRLPQVAGGGLDTENGMALASRCSRSAKV
jgi:hypothetical protein